jgi:hypothetical protein
MYRPILPKVLAKKVFNLQPLHTLDEIVVELSR